MSRRFGSLHYLGYVIRTGSLAVATVVVDDVNITLHSIHPLVRQTHRWERIRYLLW